MKKRDIFSAVTFPSILTEVTQTSSPLIIVAGELAGTVWIPLTGFLEGAQFLLLWFISALLCSGRDPAKKWKNTERKAALVVFLASLDTGNTEILGKNMFTYFSETVSLSLLELRGMMFTERFETSLKLLTHISFLKIGSATSQAVPVIFQGPEKVACTPVPSGHEEGISGRQWARTGLCKVSLRSGPSGRSIFVWAMTRLWNL